MDISERFRKIGEFGAAGMYEEPERSLFYRKALGLRRYYENCMLAEYHGDPLYPSGILPNKMSVFPGNQQGMAIAVQKMRERDLSRRPSSLTVRYPRERLSAPLRTEEKPIRPCTTRWERSSARIPKEPPRCLKA